MPADPLEKSSPAGPRVSSGVQPRASRESDPADTARGAIELGDALFFAKRVIDYTRVPLVIVVLAMAVLFLSAQGRDMAAALPSGPGRWRFAFFIAVFVLSTQLWFWARLLLHDRFAHRGANDYEDWQVQGPWRKRVVEHFPRVLAFGVWVGASLSVTLANGPTVLGLMLVSAGAALYAALYCRRKSKIGSFSNPIAGSNERRTMSRIRRFSVGIGVFTIIAGLGAFLIVPVGSAFALGSGAVTFLCLASINAGLSFFVYATRADGAPLMKSLLGAFAVTVVSTSIFGDNHEIRTLSASAPAKNDRLAVKDALASWTERACRVRDQTPLVVVATAGGGLRAAYFTTRVLFGLQDLVPAFPASVFAVSGASGGSVGATMWVSWLRAHTDSPRAPCGPVTESASRTPHAHWNAFGPAFFAEDYLAPLVAGLLYPDLVQRFLPIMLLPDRARYLELGWEAGFARALDAGKRSGGIDGPFALLSPPRPGQAGAWLPILLNNGTHQQSGARILTTPLAVTPHAFPLTIDFYETTKGKDIPISTAAHNTARFPVFSPSGSLNDGTGHVIDGGYLENMGAATAQDLLLAIGRAGQRDARFRPIVIQITNDSKISTDYGSPDAQVPRSHVAGPFNDLVGPLLGIVQAYQGRALEAGARLAHFTRSDAAALFGVEPIYVHFRLFPTGDEKEPAPLGWVLSPQARREIDRQLWCNDKNAKALGAIAGALVEGESPEPLIARGCTALASD